ncbi:hypothetical protein KUTeg_012881 [Tegillarca granosa]|uniref:Small-subunit processome Utp12 domain-containing protein n=1 Tax=Tegillarca granosa TaxID=220873 RepID=A0ABQ9EWN6_TEGGR|nr:hypothetical protein KUTeg_012881 [Tegillarca granosa]
MAATTVISPNGEYILHSSPDGVLKLWETESGVLKQEYTPSSHLSATCTCLSWSPKQQMESPRKKKRKKSGQNPSNEENDFVAIGTTAGNILLYNEGGHSDVVNDLAWSLEDNTLYSCSNDHHIAEWNISTGTVNHKWKADKGAVHSLCLCSQHQLLSAGRRIKLWNTQTRQVIKNFTGHATEVFKLLTIPHIQNPGPSQSCYFLSAATFLLAVVVKSGKLLIFEGVINGKLNKPLKPKVTVQITTPVNKSAPSKSLPVLGAHLCNDKENNILLVHGNFIKPVFEKLIKTPEVSKDLTVLAPGFMAPERPTQDETAVKRKKRKLSVSEMTIEDRLNAISMDVNGKPPANEPPKADTLSKLLTQGLQSQDKKILNNVLQNRNATVIKNTVKKLPVQVVIPLIQEICKRMHGHSQSGEVLVKWTKAVLTTHTSFLLSMMESRTAVLGKLSRLQGKLDLVLSQITSQEQQEEAVEINQPLLMYQEDSSDSDIGMEDIVPSQSEQEVSLSKIHIMY